tara:strand:+ start:3215 stop:3628 length:414 start_codon:yes stop_codon:yes gene_type:complete
MDLEEKEFKVFGKNMENISLYYGIFLILWGLIISYLSGSSSMTSYIPSYLGLGIFIFSILTLKFPNKKKMFMHIVVFLGLITLIGGLDLIRGFVNGNLFDNFWADLSKLMMILSGGCFVYLCILSFRFARLNKSTNS